MPGSAIENDHMLQIAYLRQLGNKTREDDVLNGAAVLGFFLTLAIFPAMILTMALIPYLPIERVDIAIIELLDQVLPPKASLMFTDVVHEITQQPRGGALSFGVAGSLWATSTGMYAVMQQLNTIYGVKEGRGFARGRLVAILLSLLFVLLVIGSFSLVVLGGVMQDWLVAHIGVRRSVLTLFAVMRWIIIALGLLLGFGFIYYLAPNTTQRFSFVSPGSFVGVVLLVIASLAFAYYVRSFGYFSATYGSIGAVIVLMLWLYIAGLSILIGAEINALEKRPKERAVAPRRR